MFKIILSFLFVFGVFFFGIHTVRTVTGMEKWALTKIIGYSILCAVLTTALLIGIVIIF